MIWTIVTIAFILTSLWFYRYFVRREAAAAALAEKERAEKLMKEGVRIVVDLHQCELRTGIFPVGHPEPDQINDINPADDLPEVDQAVETKTGDQTTLVYTHTLENGRTIRFFAPTFKEKKTVQLLCTMQGTTSLYYERNNPEHYYFDLRFLD
jgi:hypothetical protein